MEFLPLICSREKEQKHSIHSKYIRTDVLNDMSSTMPMYRTQNMHRSARKDEIRDYPPPTPIHTPTGFPGFPLVSGIVCLLISEVSLGTLMWKVGCV